MHRRTTWLAIFLACFTNVYLYQTAQAQAFTEMRDPLRGVTFYSRANIHRSFDIIAG